jgi:hypothetical protein
LALTGRMLRLKRFAHMSQTLVCHRPTSAVRIARLQPVEFRRLHHLSALFATLLAGSSTAIAAESLTQSQQPIANFAFASQLGAGVYAVDGRSVQIYRLPFDWELDPPSQDRVGLDITLPVTLGFYGYHIEDVVTEGLPKSVDTYSFLPGLEVSRLVGAQWRLATFGEVGTATVHSGSNRSLIYATGLRARYDFRVGEFYTRYATELLYAGTQVPKQVKDTMTRLSNGVDARHHTPMSMRGETVDFGPYVLSEWYLKRPTAPTPSPGPPMAALQWEVGVTIGTVRTSYLWKIPIPRIGVGYRFGSDLSIVRLVFGSAF